MAQYNYEGSHMAAYFILSFLSLVLLPLTLSFRPFFGESKTSAQGCNCPECVESRKKIALQNKRSILQPKLTLKAIITIIGWILFAIMFYVVATTKVESTIYNPFEILGITEGTSIKDIKRFYKRLSLKHHPDTVKLQVNQTIEQASAYFVEITKAYKSLTDETVRKNLEDYGNPDGKQSMTVGIALPPWIVDAQNNIWVLGVYALLFGGALPYLVGKWWFGSRSRTKDGVQNRTASLFFRNIREETASADILQCIGKSWEIERPSLSLEKAASDREAEELEKSVANSIGSNWQGNNLKSPTSKRAFALLYAHLLKLPISNSLLRKEQDAILLHTPALLTSLLSIALSHNWLLPTLEIMHLHANLAQALLPGSEPLLQFPSIRENDIQDLDVKNFPTLLKKFNQEQDDRAGALEKVGERWGKLEVVEVGFKVIGERIVTPSAIVQLVFKVRLSPPSKHASQVNGALDKSEVDHIKYNQERDEAFLSSRADAEDLVDGEGSGFAHTPHWPADRRPGWWAMIGDSKLNRVVVQPMRFSDVPFDAPHKRRNYRTYKLQFQAPPNVGLYTFQVHFVSDTFVGEDVVRDIMLRVEDLSALGADEQDVEDEISEPEEDSLAGQMAAMRGGTAKKSKGDSDDDSTTDGDVGSGTDSDSDSD